MTAKPQTTDALRGVVFGDVHASRVAPAGWRSDEDWRRETESLFRQVGELCALYRPHFVACPGDWFHRKGLTGHEDVRWLIELLRPLADRYGPVLTVAGNHDMVGNNIRDSIDRQPIAVLEAAGMIRRVDLVDRGDDQGKIIPVGRERYIVIGISYGGAIPLNLKHLKLQVQKHKAAGAVVILHHELLTEQAAAATGVVSFLKNDAAVAVLNGHIHDSTVLLHSHFTGCRPEAYAATGCLMRTSVAERDVPVGITTVSMTPGKVRLKRIPLNVAPADEAFPRAAPGVAAVNEDLDNFAAYLGDRVDAPEEVLTDVLHGFAAACGYSAETAARAVEIIRAV